MWVQACGGGGRLLYACLTTYIHSSILLYHAGKQLKVVGTVELSFQRHSATVLTITFNQLTKTSKKAFNGGVWWTQPVLCAQHIRTYVCMTLYSCECVLYTYIALYTKSVIRPWIKTHAALHTFLCCALCMQNVWCGLPPMVIVIRWWASNTSPCTFSTGQGVTEVSLSTPNKAPQHRCVRREPNRWYGSLYQWIRNITSTDV